MKPSGIDLLIRNATNALAKQILVHDPELRKAVDKGSNHLTINSSFILREKASIKTDQCQQRLVLKLAPAGAAFYAECVGVTETEALKSHYRPSKAAPAGCMPIEDAARSALETFGNLVFALLGKPVSLRAMAEPVSAAPIRELRLDPTLQSELEMPEPGILAIRRLVAIEEIFAKIQAENDLLTDADRRAIAKAYENILEHATTDVSIPTGTLASARGTILGDIASSLSAHAKEYSAALRNLEAGKNGALNDVLRIAYNFTTDALPLIFLFVSICDLKPILYWCTVEKHWALYCSFHSLPWSALGRKEKLSDYQRIVSEARNQAFHHLLPFDSTIEIDLTRADVRAERIRLFCPFGSKADRGVRLQDQELANVLAEFSRAKQRPVSRDFWRANEKVILAAADLAQGTVEALTAIHNSLTASRAATPQAGAARGA